MRVGPGPSDPLLRTLRHRLAVQAEIGQSWRIGANGNRRFPVKSLQLAQSFYAVSEGAGRTTDRTRGYASQGRTNEMVAQRGTRRGKTTHRPHARCVRRPLFRWDGIRQAPPCERAARVGSRWRVISRGTTHPITNFVKNGRPTLGTFASRDASADCVEDGKDAGGSHRGEISDARRWKK